MNQNILLSRLFLLATLGISTTVLARPEYMLPTGATTCDQCHLTAFGTGYKPGMIEASLSPLGKFPGLKAWLNPAPIVVGVDTKPIVHSPNNEWNVTVGEAALSIPLRVSDAEDDNFTIQGTFAGMIVTPTITDVQTHLPMASVKWSPHAAKANQTYTVNFSAQEVGTGRTLISEAITAKIHVWPARTTASPKVSQIIIQRAQWNNNQLLLAGKVVFKASVTAEQRATSLATLSMSIKSATGLSIDTPFTLIPDTKGNWTQVLTLTANQVPCAVKLNYEGLNAMRTVKLASLASCVK